LAPTGNPTFLVKRSKKCGQVFPREAPFHIPVKVRPRDSRADACRPCVARELHDIRVSPPSGASTTGTLPTQSMGDILRLLARSPTDLVAPSSESAGETLHVPARVPLWTPKASLASCVAMNLRLLSLGWLVAVSGACLVAGCGVDDPQLVGQGGSGGSSTAGKGGASSAGKAGGKSTAGNSGGESEDGEAGEGGSTGSAETGGTSGSAASTGSAAGKSGASGGSAGGASGGSAGGTSEGSAGNGGISGTGGSGGAGGSGGWTGTTSSIPLSSYLPTSPACSSTGGSGGAGASTAGAAGSGGAPENTGGISGLGGSSGTAGSTGGGAGAGAASGAAGSTGGTVGAGGASGAAGSTGGTAGAAAGSGGTGGACYDYDSTAQTVTVIGRETIQFPLPHAVSVGQSVVVHVTGTNQATTGLRSWLVDNMQVTSSNVVVFTGQNGSAVPPASFTLDYTLTVTAGTPWFLFFKAPTSGGIIENITFLTITVTL
jgi:hypothetical protein